MSMQRDADKLAKQRLAEAIAACFGRFKVASTSPLEVYLNGDESQSVPAVGLPSETYSVGTTGQYFMQQGQLPVCLPTTT